MNTNRTLGEFITKSQLSFPYVTNELSNLLNAIRLAAKVVNHEINKADLVDVLGTYSTTNNLRFIFKVIFYFTSNQ